MTDAAHLREGGVACQYRFDVGGVQARAGDDGVRQAGLGNDLLQPSGLADEVARIPLRLDVHGLDHVVPGRIAQIIAWQVVAAQGAVIAVAERDHLLVAQPWQVVALQVPEMLMGVDDGQISHGAALLRLIANWRRSPALSSMSSIGPRTATRAQIPLPALPAVRAEPPRRQAGASEVASHDRYARLAAVWDNERTEARMLTRRSFAASALAVAAAGFLAAEGAGAADLDLRMSVESAPGAATQVMLAAFRDALQEELGDTVAIEYFDGGTLGDEIVHMEMVRSGQLDVIPIGSDAVQLDAKWAVFDMPFLIPDREIASARSSTAR